MTNPKQIHFFDAVRERRFGASTCFLCGCRLGKKNRSDEHVIPKWIQRRFGLTNQELHLLNKTTIPYRQLTIPCCYTCNNALLQPIENRMASAVERGATAVRSMAAGTYSSGLGRSSMACYTVSYSSHWIEVENQREALPPNHSSSASRCITCSCSASVFPYVSKTSFPHPS